MALNFDWNNLKEEFKKGTNIKQNNVDDRFWKLDVPKDKKTSQALIRFLPDKNNNLFVKYLFHGFYVRVDGVNKFFYEICPRTLNIRETEKRNCPLCNQVAKLYASPFESDKSLGQTRKTKTKYVSNILVLKDPAHPENEGKVFLFQYGKKIFDKLKDVWMPDEDEENIDNDIIIPFDPLENGADFLLKSKIVSDFVNYDNSTFKSKKALFNGDESKIEEIINQTYDLNEFYENEIKAKVKDEDDFIRKMKEFKLLLIEKNEENDKKDKSNDIKEDIPDFDNDNTVTNADDVVNNANDIDDIDFDDDDF